MIEFRQLAAHGRRLALAAGFCCAVLAARAPARAAQEEAPPAEHGLVERYFTLARALEQGGHDEQAREQYLRVLEREERHLPTLHALALLEQRGKALDAAVDYAGRFLETWRHLKHPPGELFEARRVLTELVNAADPLRKRLDTLRRAYVTRLLELANRQMDRAAWHSARAILVEAIATDPEHPELAAGLERIRLEAGNELAVEDETGGSDPLAGVTPRWVDEQDAAHAEWETAWTEETEHYRIRTNAGYRMLRTVANAMEQMHEFYRIFHQYKQDGGSVPVAGVNIFKDRDEYKSIGEAPTDWAAGHWDGSKVVTYDQRGAGEGSLRGTLQVLFHEASHQFTSLAGGSSVPAWLNEGMASFFEGTRLLSNGKVDWNLVAEGRLYPLVEELRTADRNHLANVIAGEVDDYRVYYPWGWGIVYHLYNAEDETGRLLYRPLMKEYFQEYSGEDHVGRFTEFFVQRAHVPGIASLDDFEQRFIGAMFRLEAEDKGEVDAARAYEERGDLQVALADWPRAVELYDRALQRDPDHPEVLWKLAYALERAELEDRAAGTLRQWLAIVDLDGDQSELAVARRGEAEKRILRLDDLARRLAQAREEYHAESVELARKYRELGFPRTALRVLRGPATALPPSLVALELFFAIQDESGVGLESWKVLFNESDLAGFYGDGIDDFRVVDGAIVGRIEPSARDEQPGGRPPRDGGGDAPPATGPVRRMGTSFLFRRLFIDREPAGDWSLSAEIGFGDDCRMAGICFGKKADGLFHGAVLLPEGFVDLSRFELDGEPIVRAAAKLSKDWNRLQIDVAGTRMVVSVNGEIAIDYEFETRAAMLGDFGLLAGEGRSSYREVRMLEYDRSIPRRARIGRRPSGARVTEGGAYTPPERAAAGAPTLLGSAPPLLRGLTFANEAPAGGDLDRLLGWPVLLAFTKTTVEPTHPVLPVLDKIAERHGDLAIPVLIVSNEQHETVASWVERNQVKYPMASCWEQEAYEDYGLAKHGIPRMLLLDLDGSVVWEGNPDFDPEYGAYIDEPLDELVKRRKLSELRAAGPALERAEALFDEGKYVDAAREWKAVADLDVPHPTVVAARAGLARIEASAAERLDAARAFREEGRLLQALAVLDATARAFEGTRGAQQASEQALALAESREYREALKAGNRVARAEKLLISGKLAELADALRKALEKSTPADDPWAAERAQWLLEGIAAKRAADELLADYLARWPELEDPRQANSD